KETKSPDPEDTSLAKAVQPATRDNGGVNGGGAGGPSGPPFQVALSRPESVLTPDHAFWGAIRNRTEAISFDSYSLFINRVLCSESDVGYATCDKDKVDKSVEDIGAPTIGDRKTDLLDVPSIYGVDAYNLLKIATQAFLLFEAGVAIKPSRDPGTGVPPTDTATRFVPGEKSRTGSRFTFDELSAQLNDYLNQTIGGGASRGLPYLKRITDALLGGEDPQEKLPFCFDLVRHRFSFP